MKRMISALLGPGLLLLLAPACIFGGGDDEEEDDPALDCTLRPRIDLRVEKDPMPLELVRIDYIMLVDDAEGTTHAVPTEISLDPEPVTWMPDDPFESWITEGSTASFVAPMVQQDYVLTVARQGCPDQFYEEDIPTMVPETEGGVTLSSFTLGAAADDAAWSPDGSRFVVAGQERFLILFDSEGNRLDSVVPGIEYIGWDYDLTWSPNGDWLAFNGLVFQVVDDELVPFTWLGDWLGVLFTPEGRYVYLTDGFGLYRWDLETVVFETLAALPTLIQDGDPIEPIDMSISATGLITVDRFVINPTTGQIVQTLSCESDSGGQEHIRVRLSDDGTTARVQGARHVCELQLATGDELWSIEHQLPNNTSFTVQDDLLTVTGWETVGDLVPRTLEIFDVSTGSPVLTTAFSTGRSFGPTNNPPYLGGAAWSPDGTQVVLTGNGSGNLDPDLGADLWDADALVDVGIDVP